MDLESILDEINKIIEKLNSIIQQKNKSGDYFINSLCEDIFIETFNAIFNCNLKNLNYSKPNAPAIDLLDLSIDKKIIIQVTSSNTPKKLLETITKYDNNIDSYGEYKELYHFILTKKSNSYKQKQINSRLINKPTFIFNIHEHIIDIFSISNLLKKSYSNGLRIEKIVEIKDNLEKAINGFEFKFESIKLKDKNLFNKTNYKFKEEELKLERTLINDTNQLLCLNDLINDESIQYILIKSDAGYGKSFLLNDTFNFLFEQSMKSYNNITPYILNLKEFNNSKDFKENISVLYFDKRKKPLLLLDGLDEITDDEEQKDIENKLLEYLKNHQNVKCIISSRNSFKKINIKEDHNDEKIAFKKYILSKLNERQIENYLKSKNILKEIKSDSKFQKIEKSLQIPFNLYNVCQYYIKNRKLSESIIYINHKRIDEDIKKYSKKNEMLLVKTRVSLERLAIINNIIEKKFFSKREIGSLINYDEEIYQIFKKINLLHFDEIDEKVRFNNNNKYFEDILVTYFFKNNNPEKIFEIFLINDNEYLIPNSWYNSLSMLVSTLGIESSFSKNIMENHPYILIQSEEVGLSVKDTNKIFQNIFNIYQKKDIWINEQQFDLNKLAKFGDTDENFEFLILKIDSKNQRTKTKAISLLSDFIPNKERGELIVNRLELEINDSNNKYTIKTIFNCLSNYKEFISAEKKVELINLSANSETDLLKYNEYIRSGVYKFILVNDLQDEFLDYLFEGLELIKFSNKGKYDGRDKTTLLDEGIYLDNLFFNLKSKKNITKSIDILFNNYKSFDERHANKIFNDLIKKSTEIINSNKGIKIFKKELILTFSKYNITNHNWGYWKEMVLNFKLDDFIKNTLQAEYEVLENLIKDEKIFKNYFLISADGISELITNNNYNLIIKIIDTELIKINEGIRLYEFIEDKSVAKKIKEAIIKKGGIIENEIKNEYDNFKLEQIENFKLLFNEDNFKESILKFFGSNNKIEIPWDEIPNWYKGQLYFHQDFRLNFLRELTRHEEGRTVEKNKVITRFNKNLDWYLIKTIFQNKSRINYNFSEDQITYLSNWISAQALQLNFKDAIYDVYNNSFKLIDDCNTIYSFAKELNVKLDKNTNLDLLSFFDMNNISSNYDEYYNDYFKNLITEINDLEAVKKRVNENLKNKVKYSSVLNNHIIFSFNYNVIENYPLIEKLLIEYLSEFQHGHFHDNPILVYYDKSKNFDFLKNNFPTEITDLFWALINYLIDNNEHQSFVEEKLLNKIDITQNYDEKLRIISNLLKINSKNALLKFYETLDFIKKEGVNGQFRHYDYNTSIYKYENEEIETAIKIIELTFQFEFDNFDNPRREIIAYLKRMIIRNKENYNKIKSLIENLINDKKGALENIQFLEFDLNDFKETFYSNYKSNYTLKDALKIISKIEN